MLALQAQQSLARDRGGDVGVVAARLTEAEALLGSIVELAKTASTVRAGASKVVGGLEALHESLARCLAQASAALDSAPLQVAAAA